MKKRFSPISPFHRRMLLLVKEMESAGHLLFYDVSHGECRFRINDEEEPKEILLRHFPDSDGCAGGGGSTTYKVPSFDGSIPDGYHGEAIVDEASRFRFLDRAKWVQVTKKWIYVWHGGDRIDMYELNGLFHTDMLLKEEPSLELVQREIEEDMLRD